MPPKNEITVVHANFVNALSVDDTKKAIADISDKLTKRRGLVGSTAIELERCLARAQDDTPRMTRSVWTAALRR